MELYCIEPNPLSLVVVLVEVLGGSGAFNQEGCLFKWDAYLIIWHFWGVYSKKNMEFIYDVIVSNWVFHSWTKQDILRLDNIILARPTKVNWY